MKRALNNLQALWFWQYRTRRALLRRMGADVGSHVTIEPNVHCSAGRLSIGDFCYVNVGCFFDAAGGITIGTHCYFGQRAHIVTSSHEIGEPSHRAGKHNSRPVVIGDGCWLGAEAMILPGVTVAPGCVIGARALVTKDTAPNGLYLGSPAVRVRDLDPIRLRQAV